MSLLHRSLHRKPTHTHSHSLNAGDTHAGGQALDSAARATLEPRFGHSFANVRIHADAAADQRAQQLEARAFTTGHDIFFRQGTYDPASPQGLHLLAHELSHVVQQRNAPGPVLDAASVSQPGDASETEAASVANQVMAGNAVQVSAPPSAPIARAFWNGNDPENDFWGTKETFGPQTGSAIDAGMSTAWDAIGLIPEVGAAASTGVDIAKATASGGASAFFNMEGGARDFFGMGGGTQARLAAESYGNAASRFSHDASWDALGLIPGFGTMQSAAALGNDGAATIDRATGGPTDVPLAGDYWHKLMGGIGL